jgi:adenylate cyclase class 2
MDYEVELKYWLTEVSDLRERLAHLGAMPVSPEHQSDTYFAHPCRSFVETDEAFRIRSVESTNSLTYKGPRLDRHTKSRREIIVEFESGAEARERMFEVLRALGFVEVATVRKCRAAFALHWESHAVELCVDDVSGLGLFVELESLATSADWQWVRESLLRLAHHLQLDRPERRSYLELLLPEGG